MSDLLSRDVLVVDQKAKLIELTNEYRILDEEGNQVGVIREEGQSVAKKALRAFTKLDQFLTHRLSLHDEAGNKVLEMVRPRKFMKSTVEVSDGSGTAVGRIVQRNIVGKKRFDLEAVASPLERSTRRTGGRGTSPSMTSPARRSAGSPRSGPAS